MLPSNHTIVSSPALTQSKDKPLAQRQRVPQGQHSSDIDTQSSHSTHVTSGLSTNHESDETNSNRSSELEKSYENTQNKSQASLYTARMNNSSYQASETSSRGRLSSCDSQGAHSDCDSCSSTEKNAIKSVEDLSNTLLSQLKQKEELKRQNNVNTLKNLIESFSQPLSEENLSFTPSTPYVHKFRTEMCRSFETYGKCKYGDKVSILLTHTINKFKFESIFNTLIFYKCWSNLI